MNNADKQVTLKNPVQRSKDKKKKKKEILAQEPKT